MRGRNANFVLHALDLSAWDNSSAFRSRERRITAVFGTALLVEAILRGIVVFSLPVNEVGRSVLAGSAPGAVLIVAALVYTRLQVSDAAEAPPTTSRNALPHHISRRVITCGSGRSGPARGPRIVVGQWADPFTDKKGTVMKLCCTCHEFKEFTQFNKRAAAPDGLRSRCRECSRKWYLANREAHMENVRGRNSEERIRIRQRVRALLAAATASTAARATSGCSSPITDRVAKKSLTSAS